MIRLSFCPEPGGFQESWTNGQLLAPGTTKREPQSDRRTSQEMFAGYDEVVDNKAFHDTGVYEYAADGSVSKENLTEIRKAGKYRIRVKVHPKIEEVDFDLIVGAENK
jgi:hypothetical protein